MSRPTSSATPGFQPVRRRRLEHPGPHPAVHGRRAARSMPSTSTSPNTTTPTARTTPAPRRSSPSSSAPRRRVRPTAAATASTLTIRSPRLNNGYGYNDYGPTVYTDISPIAVGGLGATLATPYRDKTTRANGLLKQGMTRIAEITDGTSNTIAIAEDAGRDPRYLSPYTEGYYNNVITRQAAMAIDQPQRPGAGGRLHALSSLLALGRARRGLRRLRLAQQQVPPRSRGWLPGARAPRTSPRATMPATTTRSPRSTRAAPTSCSATAASDSSRTRSTRSPCAAWSRSRAAKSSPPISIDRIDSRGLKPVALRR